MRKNINKWMKVLSVMLIVIIVVIMANSVYGAINVDYAGAKALADVNTDEMIKKNPLINPIGQIVYFVGLIMERTLTFVFQMITGEADFPWADKIVFNAIPMLDVNFINPDTRSMMADSAIATVVSRTYATVFTLCTTFFSISVMIMAIKLATTIIASEKAKYKQAIGDWLVGLVLLFTIHIAISFIFYLNETIVVMASQIATNNIDDQKKLATVAVGENVQKLIQNATAAGVSSADTALLAKYPNVVSVWMTLPSGDTSKGIMEATMKKDGWLFGMWDSAKIPKEQYAVLVDIISYITQGSPEAATILKGKLINAKASIVVEKNVIPTGSGFSTVETQSMPKDLYTAAMGRLDGYVKDIFIETGGEITSVQGKRAYLSDTFSDLIAISNAAVTGTGKNILISDLAAYFKYNTWTYSVATSGTVTNSTQETEQVEILGMKTKQAKTNVLNALMYAILVVQSLILFIAYVKRMFFVIILALMAPVMVVFDFVNKSLGK